MRATRQTLLTAEDLLRIPAMHQRHELIRGELHTMTPAGSEHGIITATLAHLVRSHVVTNGLGFVFGAETGFQIESDPDTVRAPDLAFVSRDRIPESGIPRGFWPGAPDLAIEVISPSDTYEAVDAKVRDWLGAGARAVWILNPRSRTVAIHGEAGVTLHDEDALLRGGDLLPGWECRVGDLFP